ncbi:exonuclease domain-containing protein [Salinibacterium sp. ZJ77]|uniref:exonuclease domain-containing protein n=1 Tax=Salinibacterium sp. ZJ77 TaxID=2708337 RepID=UPI001420B01C|nr:exonuclease domain-containing protein [Salinibacterium sp. ZJ77]
MAAEGFAVIDVETTGFSPRRGDRIVELAIVHVSPDGEIEGRWDTLVNPMRDVGATHIHGITASDVAYAPQFSPLAPRVLNLLSNRVLVAHNLAFDTRFLFHELSGITSDQRISGPDQLLFQTACTMRLASEFFPGAGRSLDACCQSAGIPRDLSHRAIADAEATSQLLAHYLRRSRSNPFWNELSDDALAWQFDDSASPEWFPREHAAAPRPHFIERLLEAADGLAAPGAELDYLGLLDRALLDGYLSSIEQDDLVETAHELGLSRADVQRLHTQYFERMAAIAWADGELTTDEAEELLTIAAALRLDDRQIDAALQPGALHAPAAPTEKFELPVGAAVVLTGDMSHPRSAWEAHLAARGYKTTGSVSKKTAIVAAADPESRSGKAKRAHELGIPVVSEAKLATLAGWPA